MSVTKCRPLNATHYKVITFFLLFGFSLTSSLQAQEPESNRPSGLKRKPLNPAPAVNSLAWKKDKFIENASADLESGVPLAFHTTFLTGTMVYALPSNARFTARNSQLLRTRNAEAMKFLSLVEKVQTDYQDPNTYDPKSTSISRLSKFMTETIINPTQDRSTQLRKAIERVTYANDAFNELIAGLELRPDLIEENKKSFASFFYKVDQAEKLIARETGFSKFSGLPVRLIEQEAIGALEDFEITPAKLKDRIAKRIQSEKVRMSPKTSLSHHIYEIQRRHGPSEGAPKLNTPLNAPQKTSRLHKVGPILNATVGGVIGISIGFWMSQSLEQLKQSTQSSVYEKQLDLARKDYEDIYEKLNIPLMIVNDLDAIWVDLVQVTWNQHSFLDENKFPLDVTSAVQVDSILNLIQQQITETDSMNLTTSQEIDKFFWQPFLRKWLATIADESNPYGLSIDERRIVAAKAEALIKDASLDQALKQFIQVAGGSVNIEDIANLWDLSTTDREYEPVQSYQSEAVSERDQHYQTNVDDVYASRLQDANDDLYRLPALDFASSLYRSDGLGVMIADPVGWGLEPLANSVATRDRLIYASLATLPTLAGAAALINTRINSLAKETIVRIYDRMQRKTEAALGVTPLLRSRLFTQEAYRAFLASLRLDPQSSYFQLTTRIQDHRYEMSLIEDIIHKGSAAKGDQREFFAKALEAALERSKKNLEASEIALSNLDDITRQDFKRLLSENHLVHKGRFSTLWRQARFNLGQMNPPMSSDWSRWVRNAKQHIHTVENKYRHVLPQQSDVWRTNPLWKPLRLLKAGLAAGALMAATSAVDSHLRAKDFKTNLSEMHHDFNKDFDPYEKIAVSEAPPYISAIVKAHRNHQVFDLQAAKNLKIDDVKLLEILANPIELTPETIHTFKGFLKTALKNADYLCRGRIEQGEELASPCSDLDKLMIIRKTFFQFARPYIIEDTKIRLKWALLKTEHPYSNIETESEEELSLQVSQALEASIAPLMVERLDEKDFSKITEQTFESYLEAF